MVSKKSGLVITVVGILSILFSVAYISSCTKPLEDNPWSCNYVICNNGGVCDSAKCICPVGYEGRDCSVKTIQKFYGNWKATFVMIGSSNQPLPAKRDSIYLLEFKESATLTTFFINNFNNNINYSHILCKMDSVDHTGFRIDTTLAQNMYYDQYRILGGWGILFKEDSIKGQVTIRKLNSTMNWQTDTFNMFMRRM